MGKILRRSFLIGAAAIAGGVAFGAYKIMSDPDNPLEAKRGTEENPFNPYVTITDDDVVSVYVPRSEMGQGVNTTLAAYVAEELDIPLERINVVIAPASYAYYNSKMLEDGVPFAHFNRAILAETVRASAGTLGKVLGLQVTGGSSSANDAYERMREAGAAARETLKLAAFQRTGMATDDMKTVDGTVVLPDGTALTYGDLAKEAADLQPPSGIELRDPSTWTQLGTSQPRTDMRAKVTGAPIFGIDVDLPDMLYATIKMNPRLGGPMVSFDGSAAKEIKGVVDVIDMTGPDNEAFGGGFAVIAENTWAAFKGAEAVDVEWGAAPYPATTDAIMAKIDEALEGGGGDNLRDDGDVGLAFADAPRDRVVEARYSVPYLAHATMEPMNATAMVAKDGSRLDIWTGTQMPTIVRSDCAAEAGVEADSTFVNTTLPRRRFRPSRGGGFRPLRHPRGESLSRPSGADRLEPRGRPDPRHLSPRCHVEMAGEAGRRRGAGGHRGADCLSVDHRQRDGTHVSIALNRRAGQHDHPRSVRPALHGGGLSRVRHQGGCGHSHRFLALGGEFLQRLLPRKFHRRMCRAGGHGPARHAAGADEGPSDRPGCDAEGGGDVRLVGRAR